MTYCRLVKVVNNPKGLRAFVRDMSENLRGGHFSIYPCNCKPPCRKLSDEEWKKVEEEIAKW